MDNTNELSNTQNAPQTGNPQNAAPAGGNNAADFQSTAPSETLNQEAENLTVEQTGDPITGGVASSNESFPVGWAVVIGVVIVAGIWLLIKLFKEEAEETRKPAAAAPAKRASSKAASSSKAATKKPAAKKKKTTSGKKRKKSTKKKR